MRASILAMAGALALMSGIPAQANNPRELTAHEQRVRDIYRDIIAFRTARGHEQVDEMVAYLTGRLSEAGFDDGDIMVTDYDSDGDATQGLIVRYRGDGSSGERPIALLAHMDVVDALPEDWERDPFTLIEEGGYFFARGTMDNKYGVANLTGTFIRLKKEGWMPSRDLYLVFSGDEETGMISTRAQARWVADNVDPAYVLNSDSGGIGLADDFSPLAQNVQLAEKTYVTFDVAATNPGGHSSRPRDDNAIYDLATALTKVSQHRFPVRESALTRSYFAALGLSLPGDLGKAMRDFSADPSDAKAIEILRADPGYVGTLGTTCIATMLKAGHAENALPQSASAAVNCRVFPGVGVDEVRDTLAQVIGNDAITITQRTEATESPISVFPSEVRAAVAKSLTERFGAPIPMIPNMSSGGTDGMHYRTLGYNTIAIGVGASRQQDNYNHGLNERLRVDSFYDGLDHWTIVLKELAGR